MRDRDVRVIAFCVLSTIAVFAVVFLTLGNWLAAVGLAIVWDLFLLTRPRIQRMIRRLRGEPDWTGYFKD